MALDAGDERRLDEKFARLDKSVDHLFEASQKLSLKLNSVDERLKSADGRNKALWGLSTALFLGLNASLISHFTTTGAVDANVKSNARRIDELQSEVKTLTAELHEYERRASIPKPEAAKQP